MVCRSVVESFAGQLGAQGHDQLDRGGRQPAGAGVRAPGAGLKRRLTLESVALDQP